VILPCNWAQVLEGAIDSAHSSSLHSSDFVPARVKIGEATDKGSINQRMVLKARAALVEELYLETPSARTLVARRPGAA
jgi:hypothetical protein